MSHDYCLCDSRQCVYLIILIHALICSNTATQQHDDLVGLSWVCRVNISSTGGCQVSGKSSCPSCCSSRPTVESLDDTGNGSAESKNRLGIQSHCVASVTPVSTEASCRSAHTRRVATGRGEHTRKQDGEEDLWEIPGRDSVEVSSCCWCFWLSVSSVEPHRGMICFLVASVSNKNAFIYPTLGTFA